MKWILFFAKVGGSMWLLYSAVVLVAMSFFGFLEGPYLLGVLFGITSVLCLAGIFMLWLRPSIHWSSTTALFVSAGLAGYYVARQTGFNF